MPIKQNISDQQCDMFVERNSDAGQSRYHHIRKQGKIRFELRAILSYQIKCFGRALGLLSHRELSWVFNLSVAMAGSYCAGYG